jgi:DNA adenine methylase
MRKAHIDTQNTVAVKPFVKWAGGKGQLLKEIRRTYPAGLGTKYTKYAEPFVGGGAVLFDILNNYQLKELYISDINRELIATYRAIRDSVDTLVEKLSMWETDYIPLYADERKKYYYNVRDSYNQLTASDDIDDVECAVRFIFLNKTCFNGLYRVNRKGQYNVPMGAYKNPRICDSGNLFEISRKLQRICIECVDYRNSMDFIDQNTFVYFDPPYRPLTDTASFTAYTENVFDDDAQRDLARFVEQVNIKGAKVVVSNSDPKNADKNDDFFDKLYAKLNINRVEATRMINSNSNARGQISELLIANY